MKKSFTNTCLCLLSDILSFLSWGRLPHPAWTKLLTIYLLSPESPIHTHCTLSVLFLMREVLLTESVFHGSKPRAHSWWCYRSHLLDILTSLTLAVYLRVGLLNHIKALFLVFEESSVLFSVVSPLIILSPPNTQEILYVISFLFFFFSQILLLSACHLASISL